jgi:Tfp pilus assembly protein PilO
MNREAFEAWAKAYYAESAWQAATASNADQIRKLREALTKLCSQFPTDTDMALAGWSMSEINAACDAYDAARSALKESE